MWQARTAALAAISSIILPTVMRDGKPCGFMMMSGQMPWSLNGMSSCATTRPTTPFCPWRDENLSPSSGRRVERMRSLIRCVSFLLPESITLST